MHPLITQGGSLQNPHSDFASQLQPFTPKSDSFCCRTFLLPVKVASVVCGAYTTGAAAVCGKETAKQHKLEMCFQISLDKTEQTI